MIKKITLDQLKPGMYVHDLDCKWMDHPFVVSKFSVKNAGTIEKINEAGIRNVYIDTDKGNDVDDAPTETEVRQDVDRSAEQVAQEAPDNEPTVEVAEEINKARNVFKEANGIIKNLMEDIRIGKQVEVESVEPIAEKLISSIFRNPHALTSVARIKTKDEYTFMHSVSVAGLMITFARSQGFGDDDIREITKGALLHDIGKIMVPHEVLNKPGKLTDEEFEIMKSHVVKSREILLETPGVTKVAMDAVHMHHERVDGTGYPLGLKGDDINVVGQMSAIVDVYDALTSVRVYKDAWEPTFTLKKMLEWSPNHFTTDLIQQFVKCLGIYPVGSLVELESGLAGVVIEQNANLLQPKLRIIYSVKKKHYVKIKDLDLSRPSCSDRIVSSLMPQDYNIDPTEFL